MTSKTKKKANNTHLAHEKDGTPWIVDQKGHKIKKVRKKVRRRASIGHAASLEESQSSIEFGTSSSMIDMRPNDRDDSSKKMMSCRTVATEMSSSHHSSDHYKPQSERFRSPKGKSPKKSKKSKSHKEIDGQWWHIDDDGTPLNKIKSKKDPKGDRLSQTEHSPRPSSAALLTTTTPVSKKKKKKSSKSVRHLSNSNPELDYGSGHESPHGETTVNTTGTGSLRPKPRRLMSQPDMSVSSERSRDPTERLGGRSLHGPERRPLTRTPSGDLDMLMSQSVHDHIRKVPASFDKPKLAKQRSTFGKIGKKIGKSCKVLAMSSKNLNSKDTMSSNDKEDSSSRSRSDHDSTVISSVSVQSKSLPKDIREIDGVLWRVDDFGNKLNKVRRKSKTNVAAVSRSSSFGSFGDEDTDTKSQVTEISDQVGSDYNYSNKSMPTYSSDDGSGDSFRQKKDRARSTSRRKGRRNSAGSNGVGNRKPDSERSIYTDATETIMGLNDQPQHQPRTPKGRSRSMDLTRNSKSKSPRRNRSPRPRHGNNPEPSTPLRQGSKKQNEVVVQNLQHRLKNSEKEIARLCRVAMEQQGKMDSSKTEVKKVRDKLKLANRDKENLIMEVENLKLQIEKRKDRSNKSLTGSEELREQLCDLEDGKESLERELASEKAQARHKLEAKEEEVRFLQEELERMRSEQGDKQLAYMQKMAISDDDNDSIYSSSRNSSPQRRRTHGKSLQFVGKILGNHLKDKAEMEVALQQEEIKNLQARVFSLSQSNEKLTKELKQATLEIKEDDDEEMRMAKEAAAKAAEVASMHNPKKDLKAKVMSLSRIHRSTSEGDNESLSLSFRGGVGECVRRKSMGGGNSSSKSLHSQSFRINRKPGLY